MVDYDWRRLTRDILDHDPYAPVDPITSTFGVDIHHAIFLRSAVQGRRQALIHSYLNCLLLSPAGHAKAHSQPSARLRAIKRLVMAYGWRNIVRYYDLVTRAGINIVGQPDTFTRLLARLNLPNEDLDTWKGIEADPETDKEVAKEMARLSKLI